MPSPFLLSFTESVVARLVDSGDLLLCGEAPAVVHYVAVRLGGPGDNRQLIATLSDALVTCPEVEELYADDDALKELITALPPTILQRGAP